jgi:hypothetical protein
MPDEEDYKLQAQKQKDSERQAIIIGLAVLVISYFIHPGLAAIIGLFMLYTFGFNIVIFLGILGMIVGVVDSCDRNDRVDSPGYYDNYSPKGRP